MGRRGKSRGRTSPQDGESAARITAEIEIATAPRRSAKGQAKGRRSKGRRSAKGQKATRVQGSKAGVSENGHQEKPEAAIATTALDATITQANPEPNQQELDMEGI